MHSSHGRPATADQWAARVCVRRSSVAPAGDARVWSRSPKARVAPVSWRHSFPLRERRRSSHLSGSRPSRTRRSSCPTPAPPRVRSASRSAEDVSSGRAGSCRRPRWRWTRAAPTPGAPSSRRARTGVGGPDAVRTSSGPSGQTWSAAAAWCKRVRITV